MPRCECVLRNLGTESKISLPLGKRCAQTDIRSNTSSRSRYWNRPSAVISTPSELSTLSIHE
ncbi:Uncharacterised protein [Mycobacteroides abscessus subsp. abscessus]|nr:Uncharacterised protein [Mycobacteroides abscessus subsp. abscessus]